MEKPPVCHHARIGGAREVARRVELFQAADRDTVSQRFIEAMVRCQGLRAGGSLSIVVEVLEGDLMRAE